MRLQNALCVLITGIVVGMWSATTVSAQVFPPRPTQPPTPPVQQSPAAIVPQQGNQPPSITKTIPFIAVLGDPTKSFIQLANMSSPFDTNFMLGRGLTGRIQLEKYSYQSGNGQKSFVHVTGVSNPPLVSSEGNELRLQFYFPIIQFKTYYKDYSGEGDSALADLVAEKTMVDVFISPTIDQRRLPTYHSVRVAVTGMVKEPEKCTYFFDMIFPVNICKIAADYFKQIQPALENGMREILLQPQTRMQFEQQVFQFVRADLLSKAGINPVSPVQIEIVQSSLQGTDYLVTYMPR
ncbi:hypothetical protein W02_04630 [Nitrospira sp. KM1]|uniref:hypothetical protein n=1 Tax=Nitrospira sp. KM1 TaxID=1936990 RepID=UPI0013A72610|nr:hypothetical protein [Nitrospira sp. KM1]BCA53323.1 hypothetical protein W02_04630 [Nitrospira sp. KM1]